MDKWQMAPCRLNKWKESEKTNGKTFLFCISALSLTTSTGSLIWSSTPPLILIRLLGSRHSHEKLSIYLGYVSHVGHFQSAFSSTLCHPITKRPWWVRWSMAFDKMIRKWSDNEAISLRQWIARASESDRTNAIQIKTVIRKCKTMMRRLIMHEFHWSETC